MIRLTHGLQLVDATKGSEWSIAQPITFTSMRHAKSFAKEEIDIELCAIQSPKNTMPIPEGFRGLPPLTRDINALGTFAVPRPLPLLRDVLDQIVATSVAEYIVYTNVDIGVMPHFYSAIRRHIASGYEAIVINRRTIPATPHSPEDLPVMYSAIGKPHPGYDCFVFRRDAYPQFVLGDVCLGSGHVDTPLICSMIATSRKFLLLTDSHLTFHLGDSRTWTQNGLRDYRRHNDREATNAIRTLALHAPRRMSILLRMALRLRLIKNGFVTAEFRRMFSR